MKVKLTNAALKNLFVPDLGDDKLVQYRKGKNLPYNVEVTLPDDSVTYKSLNEGGLKSAIDNGDVTVTADTTAITQMLSHAVSATAGQTIFNLPNSYVMGNKSMHVFVKGLLQPKPGMTGASYTETNATRITLSAGTLLAGDDVQFIWSK